MIFCKDALSSMSRTPPPQFKLKIAENTPVPKKDDQHMFNNYRPISVLPVISKLLENVFITDFTLSL